MTVFLGAYCLLIRCCSGLLRPLQATRHSLQTSSIHCNSNNANVLPHAHNLYLPHSIITICKYRLTWSKYSHLFLLWQMILQLQLQALLPVTYFSCMLKTTLNVGGREREGKKVRKFSNQIIYFSPLFKSKFKWTLTSICYICLRSRPIYLNVVHTGCC